MRSEKTLIRIRGNEIDLANSADGILPLDADNSDYVLVVLNREMDQDTIEALKEYEADVIKRMVGNTWLVHYPPSDLRILERVPAVNHALVYLNCFKIHKDLQKQLVEADRGEVHEVSIMMHEVPCPNVEAILAMIYRIDPDVKLLNSSNGILHIAIIPDDVVHVIAELDSVQAIEAITPAIPYNDKAKTVSGLDHINSSLEESGEDPLTGEGQIVCVADSGVDATHPALRDQIVDAFYVSGDDRDEQGHGTHVAGTIVGRNMTNFRMEKIRLYEYKSCAAFHGFDNTIFDQKDCLGMAPKARLYVQGGLFRDMPPERRLQASQLLEMAYNLPGHSCRIHNNSWGATWSDFHKFQKLPKSPQLAYTVDDAEPVDRFALEHPDLLILFAAGNDADMPTDTSAHVGGWAAAKNVLTVGASHNNRPMTDVWTVDYSLRIQKKFTKGETMHNRNSRIAKFSSHGPCRNTLRTKPDVLAPGAGILSARSGDKNWAFGETHYGFPLEMDVGEGTVMMSGTSMATAVVSGCAALMREALVRWQDISNPSAPLMKALFVNGADMLENTPVEVQGFGEINMVKAMRPVRVPLADIEAGTAPSGWIQDVATTDTIRTVQVIVPPSAKGDDVVIKATLVYHDRAGDHIQNRMNLFILNSGNERADSLHRHPDDNVHQLIIGPLTPGEKLTLGVETKLFIGGGGGQGLPLQGTIPWALVWSCMNDLRTRIEVPVPDTDRPFDLALALESLS
ncbi:hypothetical protein PV08_07141 [Exophiala spinifera]|uniref:Peptidase S8/S53 domain-containing protein n=1 Tax=Exophiala spinifera TaxID=91928 RepID=A0A0D2BSV0_9EURO|nr:uncharacterized protein PV08_07141 [Exophiala spinifera]KIW14359.1 hypothetical protein PV08_07141 [Exophiala spinifera]